MTLNPFNTLDQFMIYFSVPGKPVGEVEIWEFWASLTPEEIEYYRVVDLKDE